MVKRKSSKGASKTSKRISKKTSKAAEVKTTEEVVQASASAVKTATVKSKKDPIANVKKDPDVQKAIQKSHINVDDLATAYVFNSYVILQLRDGRRIRVEK